MAVELAAQPLDAAGKVYIGADHREIEPVAGTDIAVRNGAVMQRDAGLQHGRARGMPAISIGDLRQAFGSGGERGIAHPGGIPLLLLMENGEYAVTHDLHNLAAMRAHRRKHAIEILV